MSPLTNSRSVANPTAQASTLSTRLGLGADDDLRGRLTNAGKPGEGGGENMRWLKLNRDEVDEVGAFSPWYEAALRRFSRGGAIITLEWVPWERSIAGAIVAVVAGLVHGSRFQSKLKGKCLGSRAESVWLMTLYGFGDDNKKE